jgi:hypothetical protein
MTGKPADGDPEMRQPSGGYRWAALSWLSADGHVGAHSSLVYLSNAVVVSLQITADDD